MTSWRAVSAASCFWSSRSRCATFSRGGGRCLLLLADRGLALGYRLLARLLAGLGLGLAGVDRGLAAGDLRLLGGEAGGLLLELRLAALELLGRRPSARACAPRPGPRARLDSASWATTRFSSSERRSFSVRTMVSCSVTRRSRSSSSASPAGQARGALVELRGAAARVDLEVRRAGCERSSRGRSPRPADPARGPARRRARHEALRHRHPARRSPGEAGARSPRPRRRAGA